MKILTTSLTLNKYKASDLNAFCDVICNDEVMFNVTGKGYSREVAKQKFKAILKINKENNFYGFYKVILQENNKVVGFAKLVPFKDKCIEIGYALLAPYWRKGYTIEIIEYLTNHSLEFFPNKRIMAIVNKENIGSIKVLEKCNYKLYKQEEFKGSPCVFFEYLR